MGAKRKYVVPLKEEEREYLKKQIQKGKVSGFRIRRAQILIKLDEIPENKGWTEEKIAQAYNSNPVSMSHMAKRYVEEWLESAINRREQENRARKVDGEVEAKVIALACSNPPKGHERWTA